MFGSKVRQSEFRMLRVLLDFLLDKGVREMKRVLLVLAVLLSVAILADTAEAGRRHRRKSCHSGYSSCHTACYTPCYVRCYKPCRTNYGCSSGGCYSSGYHSYPSYGGGCSSGACGQSYPSYPAAGGCSSGGCYGSYSAPAQTYAYRSAPRSGTYRVGYRPSVLVR